MAQESDGCRSSQCARQQMVMAIFAGACVATGGRFFDHKLGQAETALAQPISGCAELKS